MAINLELKIKLKELEEIKLLLQQAKAKFKGILNQKDIYYKYSKGLLKLRIENGSQFLIKYLRDETGSRRFSNYEIIELKGANADKYFNSIFNTECVVEKKRLLYILGNTRIHLDEVYGRNGAKGKFKKLGFFLELETVVLEGKQKAKIEFDKIIALLDLDVKQQIRASYRDLIKE